MTNHLTNAQAAKAEIFVLLAAANMQAALACKAAADACRAAATSGYQGNDSDPAALFAKQVALAAMEAGNMLCSGQERTEEACDISEDAWQHADDDDYEQAASLFDEASQEFIKIASLWEKST